MENVDIHTSGPLELPSLMLSGDEGLGWCYNASGRVAPVQTA